MDPLLGQIILFAGNFAPRGFAACDGQLLSVSSYSALFSILGTTYGGDGRSTFALPDLRSRVPMHNGRGPGLSPRKLGERTGQEEVVLNTAQIPSHTHALNCQAAQGALGTPKGNFLAGDRSGADDVYSNGADATMNTNAIGSTGQNLPHDNMPPALALNYVIAVQGTYPSR